MKFKKVIYLFLLLCGFVFPQSGELATDTVLSRYPIFLDDMVTLELLHQITGLNNITLPGAAEFLSLLSYTPPVSSGSDNHYPAVHLRIKSSASFYNDKPSGSVHYLLANSQITNRTKLFLSTQRKINSAGASQVYTASLQYNEDDISINAGDYSLHFARGLTFGGRESFLLPGIYSSGKLTKVNAVASLPENGSVTGIITEAKLLGLNFNAGFLYSEMNQISAGKENEFRYSPGGMHRIEGFVYQNIIPIRGIVFSSELINHGGVTAAVIAAALRTSESISINTSSKTELHPVSLALGYSNNGGSFSAEYSSGEQGRAFSFQGIAERSSLKIAVTGTFLSKQYFSPFAGTTAYHLYSIGGGSDIRGFVLYSAEPYQIRGFISSFSSLSDVATGSTRRTAGFSLHRSFRQFTGGVHFSQTTQTADFETSRSDYKAAITVELNSAGYWSSVLTLSASVKEKTNESSTLKITQTINWRPISAFSFSSALGMYSTAQNGTLSVFFTEDPETYTAAMVQGKGWFTSFNGIWLVAEGYKINAALKRNYSSSVPLTANIQLTISY